MAEEDPDLEQLAKDHMVFVEPTNLSQTKVDGEFALKPYRERRPRWGTTVSLSYSSYEPKNFQPQFTSKHYGELYGSPTIPLIQLGMSVKRNLSFGSLGFELGIGTFKNDHSNPNISLSTLSVTPWRIGLVFAADNLSPDPLLVPYVAGGVYSVIFKESVVSTSDNGTSQAAPYMTGGLAISLAKIDRHATRIAYEGSGIENSYFYAEVTSYVRSSSPSDHDFSNEACYGGGFRVEF